MADEAVAVTDLVLDAVSADFITAAGDTIEVNAGNTAVISFMQPADNILFVFSENGGGAATATFQAGDRPPALLAGLGTLAVAIPSSDTVCIAVQAARFMKSDGTIQIDIATQNVFVTAFRIPRGV